MPVLECSQGRLSYIEQGTGRPVVLLHASASTSGQWRGLVRDLATRHRVIALDLPGYGGTSLSGGSGRPGLAGHVSAVRTIADYCGEPVHLVGHSFGGAVAVKTALSAPELVRSLVVLEPVSFNVLRFGSEDDRRLWHQIEALSGVISASVASGDPHCALAHFVDFWNGRGAWAALPPNTRSSLVAVVGSIVNDFAAGRGERWSREACRVVACPTLAIMGMQSKPHSQRVTEMIAEAIPGARLQMVLEAGHMAPVTHSALVNRLIGAFLAEVEVQALTVVAVNQGFRAA